MSNNPLIVVSGASRGIGKAIAMKFASEGFDVAISARNPEHLLSFQKEAEILCPNSKIWTYQADMSSKKEVQAFAQFVLGLDRTLAVLVNNAGTFIPGSIHEEEDGVLEHLINTNLYSAYYLTKALLGKMMEKKQGYIFNICSIASFMSYPNGGSYAISKHALLGFSRCLREEMKTHNIQVSSVMPGATLTDSWASSKEPIERFSKPQDIADLIYTCYTLAPFSVVEDIVIRPQLGDF